MSKHHFNVIHLCNTARTNGIRKIPTRFEENLASHLKAYSARDTTLDCQAKGCLAVFGYEIKPAGSGSRVERRGRPNLLPKTRIGIRKRDSSPIAQRGIDPHRQHSRSIGLSSHSDRLQNIAAKLRRRSTRRR